MSARLLAALILVAMACARSRDVAPSAARGVADSVSIEVINDNYYDARIRVLYEGGAPYALGTIPGNQRLSARTLPWQPRPLVVEVTLIIGGGTYQSDKIEVAPGALVQIRVPPDLRTSGFFRRVSR